MALIDPAQQKKFERDPEEGNIPSGLYLCELTEVRETGPSAKFPGGNPRLIFEFTLCDPNYPSLRGKKTVAFLGKTLLKSKEGRESNLVKWARMMGIVNPEKGFDPDTLLKRKFNVMVEYTAGTNGESGRGWARQAMLANPAPPAIAPPVGPPPANPPATSAPPQNAAPPTAPEPDPAAMWDYHDGANWVLNASTADLQLKITGGLDPEWTWVKRAGAPTDQARYGHTWGFRKPF